MPEQDEMKLCSSCERERTLEHFEQGYLCCIQCIGYKRKYNETHKDKMNEAQRKRYEEDEEYRAHILKQRSERGKKIVSYSVCNCSMSQAHYHRHKKPEKHKKKLEGSLA